MALIKIDGRKAIGILKTGGLVFVPTETVYGIAVDALNEKALQRIYQLKKREMGKPISVLVGSVGVLKQIAEFSDPVEIDLMQRYWPGPLTILLKAKANLPLALHQNTGNVAVRISSHPETFVLSQDFGGVISATSANPSGMEAANSMAMLQNYFGNLKEDYYVIDGGTLPPAQASTLVQVIRGKINVIRQGAISFPS